MIYIECIGGLCNRIRTINAAYMLATVKKDDLVIIWKQNQEIMTPFNDIFTIGELHDGVSIKVKNIPYKKTKLGRRLYIVFNRLYKIIKNNINIKKYMKGNDNYIDPDEKVFSKKNIYIESCEEFLKPKAESVLLFSKYILDKVESLVKDEEYIGVHIRRTDNLISIENSTTQGFINKMSELVNENENQIFYVASDSKTEIMKMKEHFPNRIMEYKEKICQKINSYR